MRQKKLTAIVIAIVMAIATLIPTLAFAKGRPRPEHRPHAGITQMQKQIFAHSVAKNNRHAKHQNRHYKEYDHYRNRFYGGVYYGPYYESAYFNGPSAYRWSYMRHEHELDSLVGIALEAAYASYMAKQSQKVIVDATPVSVPTGRTVVVSHSQSW